MILYNGSASALESATALPRRRYYLRAPKREGGKATLNTYKGLRGVRGERGDAVTCARRAPRCSVHQDAGVAPVEFAHYTAYRVRVTDASTA